MWSYAAPCPRVELQPENAWARRVSTRLCPPYGSVPSEHTLIPHHDRRHVLEPALRLHEALELGRERARVEIVHDEDAPGILDHQFMHALQNLGSLGLVEGRLHLVVQRVEFLVLVPAPVQPDRAAGV